MQGDHSADLRHNHISISEVYKDAVHEVNLEDAQLSKKKSLISNHIGSIKDKVKELEQ